MGVAGKFWDLLKPYARHEDPDFLRDKKVAVDLSYWIVQHDTAIKTYSLNPHLRLTFFRTLNLFSKFGAFPVFVADGTPSPLKSQARIARFFRSSGIDASQWPVAEEGVSVERNGAFLKCVKDCVELIELFGMPVLKAKGEAEALCAQLNLDGHVDACITADSDAFLFGAQCVIKSIKPNAKEPFECYLMSDIEAGLGLKREHLIAISLLVGNDHDLTGVQGIGIDNALRFVQKFGADEILDKYDSHSALPAPVLRSVPKVLNSPMLSPGDNSSPKSRVSHCSVCGHPGSKRAHGKSSCEYCPDGCVKKPGGFRCSCTCCDMERKEKEQKKHENWLMKVCDKISREPNFPNDKIIEMYLCKENGNFSGDDPCISWQNPETDMLVDFLVIHQHWEPSYVRQRMLPMLSTIYLRDTAERTAKSLLNGQFEFDCIQRIKIRSGHQSFVVKWRRAGSKQTDAHQHEEQDEIIEIDEISDGLDDEWEEPAMIHVDHEGQFVSTDENMELVRAAFPDQVKEFLLAKELKESKRKRPKSGVASDKSKGVQLTITEFYRSNKAQVSDKQGEASKPSPDEEDKEIQTTSTSPLSKSARRRLLFDKCRIADL
ncbi:Flap endonuclease GEN-like 1 [Linum grandiflorum]